MIASGNESHEQANLPSLTITSPVKVHMQTESALETARCQVDQPLRRRSPNDESIPVGRHNRGNRPRKICPPRHAAPGKSISHPDGYMTMYLSKRGRSFSPATIYVRTSNLSAYGK